MLIFNSLYSYIIINVKKEFFIQKYPINSHVRARIYIFQPAFARYGTGTGHKIQGLKHNIITSEGNHKFFLSFITNKKSNENIRSKPLEAGEYLFGVREQPRHE